MIRNARFQLNMPPYSSTVGIVPGKEESKPTEVIEAVPPPNSDQVDEKCQFSFSQPAGTSDAFFLGSQLVTTPNKNCPPAQRWVKRMTRFFVTTSLENTMKQLTQVLDGLGYAWKIQSKPVLSVRHYLLHFFLLFFLNLIPLISPFFR